jgi:hypothetical protein
MARALVVEDFGTGNVRDAAFLAEVVRAVYYSAFVFLLLAFVLLLLRRIKTINPGCLLLIDQRNGPLLDLTFLFQPNILRPRQLIIHSILPN